jgi:hypothetical protein
MNKAIDTLPDLSAHWQRFQPLLKVYEQERDARLAAMERDKQAQQASAPARQN